MNPSRFLHQDLTYWAPGPNNRYGHQSSAAPILIKGRWEDVTQQVRKTTGEEVVSNATVFVDRDVGPSGFLAIGDHTGQSTPPSNVAREIQSFDSVPDLRNLNTERRAYL